MSSPFSSEELRLLEARAERLAQRRARHELAAARRERLVVFDRLQARFAIAAGDLRGVRPLPQLCRLPALPPHLAGAVNLEGRTLAVLDLARLADPAAAMPVRPWAVWLSRAEGSAVLVADEVVDILEVRAEELRPAVRGAFAGVLAARLRAVLPGPLLVLDAEALLDPTLFSPHDR